MNSSRRLILVAGVPRSGSTWLYNAARLLLEESGEDLHSAWIADWQSEARATTHLVKVHHRGDIETISDLILTTRRPTEDCLASLVRMGWLKDNEEEIRRRWKSHQELYSYWNERSSLEIDYNDIVQRPERVLEQMAAVFGIAVSEVFCSDTANKLMEMRGPSEGGYDSETLLHPGHRKHLAADGPAPEDILRIVHGK